MQRQNIPAIISYITRVANSQVLKSILEEVGESVYEPVSIEVLTLLTEILYKYSPNHILRHIDFIMDPVDSPYKSRPPGQFAVRGTVMRKLTNQLQYQVSSSMRSIIIVWDLWRGAINEEEGDLPRWYTLGVADLGENLATSKSERAGFGLTDGSNDHLYTAAFKGHRIVAGQLTVRVQTPGNFGTDVNYNVIHMPRKGDIDNAPDATDETWGEPEERFKNRKANVIDEQMFPVLTEITDSNGSLRFKSLDPQLSIMNAKQGSINAVNSAIKLVWWPDVIGNDFCVPMEPYKSVHAKGIRTAYNIYIRPPLVSGWTVEIQQEVFVEAILGQGGDELHENYSYSFIPPIIDKLDTENVYEIYKRKRGF